MPLISDGFDTGSQVLRWGATLAEALAQLPSPVESDARSAKFQATQAFGLTGIFSVTLRAPALDRPVLQAWVDLAHDPQHASDDDLLKSIARIFGPPARRTAYDLRGYAKPAFGVRCAANWDVTGFDVGISIYGAPRETPEGLSSAVFYVDWEDEIAAAAPYLPATTTTERWLAARAAHAEILWQETLEADQHPYQLVRTRKDSPQPLHGALLRAGRCLRKRLLFQTPASLAASLQANQVLVWKDDLNEYFWCVSSQFETVCFQWGQPVTISYTDLLPAKGSGAVFLTISDLELASVAGSPALARLADFLQKNLRARVRFMEQDDS